MECFSFIFFVCLNKIILKVVKWAHRSCLLNAHKGMVDLIIFFCKIWNYLAIISN